VTKIKLQRHLRLANGIELNAGEQFIESLLAAQLRGLPGVSFPDEEAAPGDGAPPAIVAPRFEFVRSSVGARAVEDHRQMVEHMAANVPGTDAPTPGPSPKIGGGEIVAGSLVAPDEGPAVESAPVAGEPVAEPVAAPGPAKRRGLPTVMDEGDNNNNEEAGAAPEGASE
jgi:hypothetical protein